MTEWNDDRLDELNGRVKAGFANVDKRFDKCDERFATREEMGEIRVELRQLNQRFDRLLYTLVAIAWGFAGTVLAATIGLIAVTLL